jgi:hypothetical protein
MAGKTEPRCKKPPHLHLDLELRDLVQDRVDHVLPDQLVVVGRAGDLSVQPEQPSVDK